MSITDYCLLCGKPEPDHTEQELTDCWTVLRMDVDMDQRPDADDVPPEEL